MKAVSDIPMRFIEHTLEQGIAISKQEQEHLNGDAHRIYFVGASLFIDTKDKNGLMDCITLNHSEETFGWFSDGTFRRLLSIKACKLFEQLMTLNNINHNPKWVL